MAKRISAEAREMLKSIGLEKAAIDELRDQLGVGSVDDLGLITPEDLVGLESQEILPIPARKMVNDLETALAPAAPEPLPELEEEEDAAAPSDDEVKNFAKEVGMDEGMLSMVLMGSLISGAGMEGMDLSAMMPVPTIVQGYNPKLRNINYLVMGQIEKRLQTPIVIIDEDGSVNHDLTVGHIMQLEEGFPPPEDQVYYDEDGNPYEIIKVGVDAMSVYDADPLNTARALRKDGMGIGRIRYTGVPLEVRQVIYYATQVGELRSDDDTKLSWLRANVVPGVKRLKLRGEFPKAIQAWNHGHRTGTLPTLRVQLSRTARKAEVMPRRRRRPVGGEEAHPGVTGEGFRG